MQPTDNLYGANIRRHLNGKHRSPHSQEWDAAFRCKVDGCNFTFNRKEGLKTHEVSAHVRYPVWNHDPLKGFKELNRC